MCLPRTDARRTLPLALYCARSLVQEHAAKFCPASGAHRAWAVGTKAGPAATTHTPANALAPVSTSDSAAGDAAAGRPLNTDTPTTPPTTARRRATRPVHTPAASLRRDSGARAGSRRGSGGAAPAQLPAGTGAPSSPGALAASTAHVAGLTSFQALSAFLCSAHDPRLASSGAALRNLGLTAGVAQPAYAGLPHPSHAPVVAAAAPAPPASTANTARAGPGSLRHRSGAAAHGFGSDRTGAAAAGARRGGSERAKWRTSHAMDVVDLPQ